MRPLAVALLTRLPWFLALLSQGGIYGATYMGITSDVERGVLGVAGWCLFVGWKAYCRPHDQADTTVRFHHSGLPYALLLPRSLDFAVPFIGLKIRYSEPLDRIFLLNGMQLLWNRIDPVGMC